jgi:hypothetical protein
MAYVGISIGKSPSQKAIDNADYVETKWASEEQATVVKKCTDRPVFLHLQYNSENRYLLPTAMDFKQYVRDFAAAQNILRSKQVSLHFGLSAQSILTDRAPYFAVAAGPRLSKIHMIRMLEHNLGIARTCFPGSRLLLENQEFIPECLSNGAYRYIQEHAFFTEHVNRWYEMGLVDGIVFDVAHALITAGNHPYYNGLTDIGRGRNRFTDAMQTDQAYLDELRESPSDRLLDFYDSYIHRLPLDLIRELHISGIGRDKSGVYVDAHREVGALEIEALNRVLEHVPLSDMSTMPVTLEYSGHEESIMAQLDLLRPHIGSLHDRDK